MRFLVLGAGGVGAFIGAKLHQEGEEVWFIGRGDHFRMMKQQGLRVISGGEDIAVDPRTIADNPATAGPVDVILFCVKTYDTDRAASLLGPALAEHTAILTFQNGVESADIIARSTPRAAILPGVAYVSSRIVEPGVVQETGGVHRLFFGSGNEAMTGRGKEIEEVFRRAHLNAAFITDIQRELWKKLIFITSMGTFTAVSRLSYGEILSVDVSRQIVFEAMREAERVAVAEGVAVEPFVESEMLAALRRFDPGTYSSMYHDLINSKPLEVEALNGAILRYAKKHRVPAPLHTVFYGALLPHHLRNSSPGS